MVSTGKKYRVAMTLAIVAALGVAGASLFTSVGPTVAWSQDQSAEPMRHAKELSQAFRQAAERTLPTVVTIKTRARPQPVSGRAMPDNPFRGTPFEDFFREHFREFQQTPFPEVPRSGVGSGVIIDSSGMILTNNHVVEGADEVLIQLPDGREFKSSDIRTDRQTDLAIVRINGAGSLPAARLGDSDELEIGDWVIAIGTPFELQQTVSAGIISGKGRELSSVRRAQFLQTDAAINPGNSGGPLVNLEGEVVGINTAIATNNGGYQGIGFAIPVNLAKWVVDQLAESGQVRRAYLGVKIGEVTAELAEQFGVAQNAGVLVAEVMPDTPAAQAGLEDGDLITEFAGRAVRTPRELQEVVERCPLDTRQDVLVIRDGQSKKLQVLVAAMPDDYGLAATPRAPSDESELQRESYNSAELGFEVADIKADEAKQLGYEGYTGVVVVGVTPGSVAAEKGLREGMLIRRVGRQHVASVQEFEAAVAEANPEEGVLLLVRTPQGGQFFLVLKG